MKNGWQTKRLGDVCNFDKVQGVHRGLPYVGLEHIESNTGRFVGSLEPQSVRSSTFKFSDKHILYGRLRPYLNKAFAPDFKGHCSTEIFPIKPSPQLLREYLLYWLLSYETKERINNTCTGARMPRADMNDVLEFDFPFPPREEQQRIVEILDEAFAGMATAKANIEKNLQNARTLFANHLQSIFRQHQEGWVETTVGGLVNDGTLAAPIDGNHGEIHPKKADFVSSGVPFIMASDLESGGVNQRDCAFISRKQAASLRKGFAVDGDVLLSHKGTIGRVAILRTDHDYVMLTPQVTYYRVTEPERILNRFLYYALQAPGFVRTMNEVAGAGSTRAYIGILKQQQLPIAFPNIVEQKRLADQLDSLFAQTQHLARVYEQKHAALEELKRSLLHEAFTGNL